MREMLQSRQTSANPARRLSLVPASGRVGIESAESAPGSGGSDFSHSRGQSITTKVARNVRESPATAPAIEPGDADDELSANLRRHPSSRDPVYRKLKSGVPRNHHLEREIAALRVVLAETQQELLGVQASEKRARYLAFHDELTGLPNRRYFRERLDRALADAQLRSSQIAVVYLDLDGFKALNDAYGHDTGDELLTIVAERLAHAVRAEDFASRLGGDEYACVMSGVPSREILCQIASTIFETISGTVKIGELTLAISPSIGIAVYPADGSTTDALLKAADAAMYVAKRQKLHYAFSKPPDVGPRD